MFTRHKTLLRLLELAGGRASRLQLVKWAFLLANEAELEHAHRYQFVPYLHGPFSFTLYHDLDVLVRRGKLARASEHDIELGPSLQRQDTVLKPAVEAKLDCCWEEYGTLDTDGLLDTVYDRYPWFTVNSAREERRASPRPAAPPAVYTVGYQGMQVDGLLNLLLETGIRRLVDVRRNPISRCYGFHKSTLSGISMKLDVDYCHFPELGIPSECRAALSDPASYERLLDHYEAETLPKQRDDVARIATMARETPSALLCMERDVRCCHRGRLALAAAKICGLPVKHL